MVIRILELLNEHMGQLYHTNLINNAYNHYDFSQVPVPASSSQEPDGDAGVVEIFAIPPLFRPIKSQTCSIGFMSGDIAGIRRYQSPPAVKMCVLTEPGVVWHYRP